MAKGESRQAIHDVDSQEGIEEDQGGITKNPIQKIKMKGTMGSNLFIQLSCYEYKILKAFLFKKIKSKKQFPGYSLTKSDNYYLAQLLEKILKDQRCWTKDERAIEEWKEENPQRNKVSRL